MYVLELFVCKDYVLLLSNTQTIIREYGGRDKSLLIKTNPCKKSLSFVGDHSCYGVYYQRYE